MKTRINGFEVEGTPQEILQIIRVKPGNGDSVEIVTTGQNLAKAIKKHLKHHKRHPNKHHIWTNEENDFLIDLYQRGISGKEIARELGRTKASVTNQIWKLKKALQIHFKVGAK